MGQGVKAMSHCPLGTHEQRRVTDRVMGTAKEAQGHCVLCYYNQQIAKLINKPQSPHKTELGLVVGWEVCGEKKQTGSRCGTVCRSPRPVEVP